MSATGSCLAAAVKTFGALPFASMIPTFQRPGLRKHPGVGPDDPLQTAARYRAPWSTQPAYCLASSAFQGGVVDRRPPMVAPVLTIAQIVSSLAVFQAVVCCLYANLTRSSRRQNALCTLMDGFDHFVIPLEPLCQRQGPVVAARLPLPICRASWIGSTRRTARGQGWSLHGIVR